MSKEQAGAFNVFVRENKDSIAKKAFDTNTTGYTVGKTKEPMFIAFDTHVDRSGEADLVYPTGLEDKLVEAGVIFERSQAIQDRAEVVPPGEMV